MEIPIDDETTDDGERVDIAVDDGEMSARDVRESMIDHLETGAGTAAYVGVHTDGGFESVIVTDERAGAVELVRRADGAVGVFVRADETTDGIGAWVKGEGMQFYTDDADYRQTLFHGLLEDVLIDAADRCSQLPEWTAPDIDIDDYDPDEQVVLAAGSYAESELDGPGVTVAGLLDAFT